ncbi:MAG: SpoIIE family protein phosphatase, partial [Thermoflexibacter sp.]|nr:SpoIIE family protein phosphatase [Thermoflexibacter sp.]
QGLNRFDINTKKFKRFVHKKEDPNSISHNGIRSLFEDSKRNLWIGTVDGLNKMVKEGIFTTYTTIDGLPSNTINAILEDKEGNLWLSTNNGISCFNSQKQTFRNYDESDGLQSNQFKSDSYFQSKDGEIYFGGVNGLNAFYPDRIKDNPNLPAIFFTDFKLFNQSVKIGDYDSLLKQHISTTKEIVLNHTQTIFSIEYVALNLTQPHKNQYAYLLEGLEKNWNYVGTQRSATYTSLDAGSYIFRVKASNNDKIWNEIGISLKITILPPWWATWWFRLMILSLIAVSAYSFYKARTNFLKKQNFKLERLVSERTQQVIERTKEIEKKSKELELANYQIQAKNKELLSSEEELRQNMEELETSQDLLREQKHTIEFAFTQLHKQNTKVNDSIRYAQRIQNAILPHENILASSFSEYFVIFKPKDVVSGDFYWYFEVDIKNEMLDVGNQSLTSNINPLTSKKFLAVVDCTGHGVPGAFMSMIGNTLLNEIITVKNIFEPHLVLEYLHIGILNSLNKKDGRMQDGMDIALCCIENQENGVVNIQFSGAKRQLYYFSDQVLGELQSTKASIGQSYFKGSYTSQNLTLKSGDILYMTTDGWIDAINQERTRFGSRRLKEMLIKGANLPLPTQKELFISILDDYEQGAEQRDDILMVGVRL